MVLRVVRTIIAASQPCWLGVRDSAKFSRLGCFDSFFLALHFADLKTSILRLEEHLVAVKSKKHLRGVLASCQKELERREAQSSESDVPTASAKSTLGPPGCKLANLDTSYTFESMIIH